MRSLLSSLLSTTTTAVVVVVVSLALSSLAIAQGGTFTQFDYPGATATTLASINSNGDMAGIYYNSSLNNFGFILKDGVYTSIAYPGAEDTNLLGMNDLDQVVGNTYNPSLGYFYDLNTQSFSVINDPVVEETCPLAINNSGTIVGILSTRQGERGFILRRSTYRVIASANRDTFANGVTANNSVLGGVSNASVGKSFLFEGDQFRYFTIPNAPSATVEGINSGGNILVGSYRPSSELTAGFVYQNRTLTTLEFPGSNTTSAHGVNDEGVVVGYFMSSFDNSIHGFIWTPSARPER